MNAVMILFFFLFIFHFLFVRSSTSEQNHLGPADLALIVKSMHLPYYDPCPTIAFDKVLAALKSCFPQDAEIPVRELISANALILAKDILINAKIDFLKEYQESFQYLNLRLPKILLGSLLPHPGDEKWSTDFAEAAVRSFDSPILDRYLASTYPESNLAFNICNLEIHDASTVKSFLDQFPNNASKVLVLLWVNGSRSVDNILDVLELPLNFDLKSCVGQEAKLFLERLVEWSLINRISDFHGGIRTLLIDLNGSNVEFLLKLVNGTAFTEILVGLDISSSMKFLVDFIVEKIHFGQFDQVYGVRKLLDALEKELPKISHVFKDTLTKIDANSLPYGQFLQLMEFLFPLSPSEQILRLLTPHIGELMGNSDDVSLLLKPLVASCEDPVPLARHLFEYRLRKESMEDICNRWMKQDIPAVTSMILESYKMDFIAILKASVTDDLPFASHLGTFVSYPGTLAILSELDWFALNEPLLRNSLCRLLDSTPTDGLTLNYIGILVRCCAMGEKAASLLKAKVSKQVTPLMFKLVMILPEPFRSEVADKMIDNDKIDTVIQDGIRMLPEDTDMLLFFGLFVVEDQTISTYAITDNIFDVVSSLNRPALYHDLTKHFTNNPDTLVHYLNHASPDGLFKRLESFPPELVDEFLISIFQSDDCTRDYYILLTFIKRINEYQKKSKFVWSGRALDAVARQISRSHRVQFLAFGSLFERILMKSKSLLGTAEETPSLCGLLNSLTQDELSIPLAKCLLSHCHRSNDMATLFVKTQSESSTLDPVLFELTPLLPIEVKITLIQTLKAHPEFIDKFVDRLISPPSDFDIGEFLNSFFVSSDKDPKFLKRVGRLIVGLSSEKVVDSFLTHLIEEKSWLKSKYFDTLIGMIRRAAKGHSSKPYLPFIRALFDPSLYTEETLPSRSSFPVLVEVIKEFYLSRSDKITSDIAQAYVGLTNSVQEEDKKIFLSMVPKLIEICDDQSKEILRELLPKV